MRLLIQHRSLYHYPEPAHLGPHILRLRPADHASATIENYSLSVEQARWLNWMRDPYGNRIARATFDPETPIERLDVLIELSVEIKPVNPFDFFIEETAEHFPFGYPIALQRELAPFLDTRPKAVETGPLFEDFYAGLAKEGRTIDVIVATNLAVNTRIKYVIRNEPGVWTPEETLANGRGSCRDSAMLLSAVLRRMGLAARFASGYLIQVTDEGMLPDLPKGLDHDVVDLHAWTEVYIPGGGWIGLDPTSGLLCSEGHIPLACASEPSLAAPIDGTTTVSSDSIDFSMQVARLGHEPRPTMPYEEPVWESMLEVAREADARIQKQNVTLTMGGEPTFNSRLYPDAPEWNGDALGPTKWTQGLTLATELRQRFTPGGVLLHRMGKHYPGESLPRWALDIYGRRDGNAMWHDVDMKGRVPTPADAEALIHEIKRRLGVDGRIATAYEDPWHFLDQEARVPVDVDPMQADLKDGEERRRLARVLNRGMQTPAGYALPLGRSTMSTWMSGDWAFRRGHLFLIPGDAPLGLRLPLDSIAGIAFPLTVLEEAYPPDPRVERPKTEHEDDDIDADTDSEDGEGGTSATKKAKRRASDPLLDSDARGQAHRWVAPPSTTKWGMRTAICCEVREYHGSTTLFTFLPPLPSASDFIELVETIDAAANALGLNVVLEGYPPPKSRLLTSLVVTPDPGVLEVNMPVTDNIDEYVQALNTVYEAALYSGLHTEKYLDDGRQAGSGGGHHLTVGGPTPLTSPFLQRPALLGRLLSFVQHHPSLSYMFTGLFVGPTSQAPRIDEARHDSLYELELAIGQLERRPWGDNPPPWYADMLFRHLLVDVTGNTHRAEISIDKLFDPLTPFGRQGIIEMRAFEMPPHPRMATAQMILLRTLVAALMETPYHGELVRWGHTLHDRFLLPYWMWKDFEDILEFLNLRGFALQKEHYRPFLDLRCPVVGRMTVSGVELQVRNAIEPWHVLGEEATGAGTSRYVDSSMERIEIMVDGYIAERHAILVNGHVLPLRATGESHRLVGGVRFRAWAPPHSLHPHIGIHHPISIEVLDRWSRRSLGGCTYHVWHPEGRAFDGSPLTRFEASARRNQRFTMGSHTAYPLTVVDPGPHHEAPYTLDLRRFAIDKAPPEPTAEE